MVVYLSVHYPFVFLLLCVSLEALPRKASTDKVHKNVSKALKIIPAALFYANMSIDTCITSCPREVLVIAVRNMLVTSRIAVLLGKTKINGMYNILTSSKTNQKIVWLDITMDKALRVDVF